MESTHKAAILVSTLTSSDEVLHISRYVCHFDRSTALPPQFSLSANYQIRDWSLASGLILESWQNVARIWQLSKLSSFSTTSI